MIAKFTKSTRANLQNFALLHTVLLLQNGSCLLQALQIFGAHAALGPACNDSSGQNVKMQIGTF